MNTLAHVAYMGLGSNIGDRESLLVEAVRQLDALPEVNVTAVSALYETDPVGYTDQPAFLNMACRVETSLEAQALLDRALSIEQKLGRERLERWGPRTIDIDVLLYNNSEIHTPALTIPHPRIMERAFVLVPLADVMKHSERSWLPGFSNVKSAADGVRRWTNTNWPEESGHSEN
jgi:2-amino-4-hydroxy-6-hydroxymethyldihydropteridine diphosphokinase